MRNDKVEQYAKIIWDYLKMDDKLEMADCIIVLGSHDIRVAKRGIELYHQGWAPLIVFSGGLGRLTRDMWKVAEARLFADMAIKAGVPEGNILIEDQSTNTGENVRYTRDLLLGKGIVPARAIAVQKPYMERRTYATFAKQWQEVKIIAASPQLSYEEYCCEDVPEGITRDDIINIMVGDLQRIKVYPEKGFQIEQSIPGGVWEAFERLVALGYKKHLI